MSTENFSWRLTYTGGSLDRAAELRSSQGNIQNFENSEDVRILPVWKGNHFFCEASGERQWISKDDATQIMDSGTDLIFLGRGDNIVWFALSLTGNEVPKSLLPLGRFEQLHPRVGSLPVDQAALLSYARGMVLWHLNHLHCGRCGAPTSTFDGGHVRVCKNSECGYRTFPRTDPAVITLVVHPDGGKCLLGRQRRWPEGMYSVVAGFVEPGESLEECVQREIREETGVETTDIRYVASQPWPFPSSLMLGFTARALSTGFHPGDDELDDIRWVSREELSTYGEMGDDTTGPKLPNTFSIARMLLERWRAEDD